jgi:CBS domain-containing protein
MRAHDLATPVTSVVPTATVGEAVLAMGQRGAILVVDEAGKLIGLISDALLLRWLLPSYVQSDEQLAGVLDEEAADLLFERVKDRPVTELLGNAAELPQVASDDSLIEVAATMVRSASPVVAVVDGDRIAGEIFRRDLLFHLAQ